MAIGGQVLTMLCPNVEFTITGDDWDSIIWNSGTAPITKKQFEDGFAQYDAWKAEKDAAKAAQKAALLERLGITQEEANLLLG
jgi:glycogen synthase